ncbi:MAG: hypothetical protein IT336_12160 [Thermomicrobiales bacterium]|nr:hypothetical protein [Thermomicrobiales bacterium]
MTTATHGAVASGPTAADVKISELSNDSLIVRLHFTINHLSRWLTPIHDRGRLERSIRRGEPSVKELLIRLRDEELRTFPKLHLISVNVNPDLDRLPTYERSAEQAAQDAHLSVLSILAEFRRLRQSTCSLLRSLPDNAWTQVGTSRRDHDWQVRSLAEHLASHDLDVLYEIDLTLDRVGARDGVSQASKAHLDELLRLVPVTLRKS